MDGVTVRRYRRADAPGLSALIFNAVRQGAAPAYDAAQRAAWAPERLDPADLHVRLSAQSAHVAEDGSGLAGLMTLDRAGHIDLAHVRPDLRGTGVAGALCDALLAEARAAGFSALTVDASHMARRFFEKRGWRLERTNDLTLNGVAMQNHRMRLDLSAGGA